MVTATCIAVSLAPLHVAAATLRYQSRGEASNRYRDTLMFTLGEAARETGKSKTTLTRAIQSGRMSANRLDDGSYQIDPAELFRVYEAVTPETDTQPSNGERRDPDVTAVDSATVALLREKIELLERTHKREREGFQERIDDLQKDRDAWQTQCSNQTLLLSHEQEKSQRGQGGLLARIFG